MNRPVPALMFLFFGFAATAGQVLLLRQGLVLAGGNELVLGAFFGAWFLGIAAGAAGGGRVVWTPDQFRWLAGLLPLLLFLSALGVTAAAAAVPPAVGHLPSLGRGMLLASALALVPGAAIGFSFPAGAAASGGIARLFLLESAGSAAGGILATLLFLRLDPAGALGVLSVLGLALLPGRARLGALAAATALWAGWGPMVALRTAVFHPVGRVAGVVNSPYQSILLTEWGGQHSLYLNGLSSGQSPDPAASERFRIARSIAGGKGETVLIADWPAVPDDPRVVWVQPDEALVRLHRETAGGSLTAVTADPRMFLNRQRGRFLLLCLNLPPAVSVAQERFFTVEFLQAAAGAMAPEGLLVVPLPVSENYWGKESARLAAGLHRTVREVFPDVAAAVGPLPCILASSRKGWLGRRLDELRGGAEGAVFSALFPRERMESFGRLLDEASGRGARDGRSFAYLDALAVREKMDRQIPVAGAILALSPWSLAALWLGVLPFLKRRNRPLAAVFSSGVLGIGAFLLLSIRYQYAHGSYYGAVGILTGLFMLGLAVSAPLGRWMASHAAASWLPDAAALAVLGLMLGVPSGPGGWFGALFVLTGVVTGLPFVFQGVRLGDDPAAAARMQFHDHLGAALGALATGLLLMPLLGLQGTVLALAGMKGVSLLLNMRFI